MKRQCHGQHAVVGLVLGMWLGSTGCVLAQTSAPASPARSLLIEYVPPALLSTNRSAPEIADEPVLFSSAIDQRLLVSPQDKSTAARWGRFETEFGIQRRSRSWVKGSLQNAKYQLDQTIFAVKEFLDHDLNFDYALRDLVSGSGRSDGALPGSTAKGSRRANENPILGLFDEARLKSDVGFSSELKGFIGIKLVLPIND